ncbi:hypothetical protein [Pseudosporangium ferrugineum]|uniref:Uncharacterized protein n=1 Tax=Pseudosporangium ferrugineum TaxID=439699 RepID=A0A2T0SFA0_9ACTN|nr:hypothetical protein [Pseudosporangium ferrugineum]PRY32095.1 hypothetical protein CLV70_102306 [Pseudosporangium ferrugineum]
MSEHRPVARRTVLAAAATGAGLSVAGGDPAAAGGEPLRPVSMAMHLHGPFSEGGASYEAHLQQARRLGVDLVWWTDHDWRVAAHDHRRKVHFDGATELEKGLAWTWTPQTEGVLANAVVTFVPAPAAPGDSGRAMRLTALGAASAGGILWQAGSAWNSAYHTCVADTVLELDVLPEQAGPDAVLLVQMKLSYHPARGQQPAGEYVLRYRVGGAGQPAYTTLGLLGIVDVPAPAGTWTRLSLRLVEDIARLWPELVAPDNSMRGLRIGVSAGPGRQAGFVVDRLVLRRERRAGQGGEELRAEVLEHYAGEYEDVKQYRAYEISLVRHLNWYGGDQTLPPFPSPPARDDDPAAAAKMIDWLHGHGGIVCWNHPMDVETREGLARLMIERHKLGADLVEIGREPQEDLLWVYDVAARNALFFTAVGASDEHDGVDWLAGPERFLTYAWAPSRRRGDVVAALRRGAAWFVDPLYYRGSLDLLAGGRPAMGAVHVTRAATVKVDAVATSLPAGSVLEIVTGAADRAGTRKLAPSVSVQRVPAGSVPAAGFRVKVRPGPGAYVRTQVRLADNRLVGAGNPVWFLPKAPSRGIPSDRRRTLPS